MAIHYIAIEGNIGTGKTRLAEALAASLNASLLLERFAENPFLAGFYENPKRFAFPLEVSFLTERYRQLRDHFAGGEEGPGFTVGDHHLEKSLVFAELNLGVQERELFRTLYDLLLQKGPPPPPDILFYLHCDAERLLDNIAQRGRDFEAGITAAYLRRVEAGYRDRLAREDRMPVIHLQAVKKGRLKSTEELAREVLNELHGKGQGPSPHPS